MRPRILMISDSVRMEKMKKILFLMMMIYCLDVQNVFSQVRPNNRVKGEASFELKQAEKSWKPFLIEFQEILRSRDLNGLETMMSEDFYYPCAIDEGRAPYGEGKDFGVRKFRDPNCSDGWETLVRLLAKGISKPIKSLRVDGRTKTIARIAPLSRLKSMPCDERDDGQYAVFEFRGGKWFFTQLSACETE